MKRFAIGFLVVCFLSISSSSWSALIYDGGLPDLSTGAGLSDLESGILSADLIQLTSGPALVTELHWWGAYVSEVPVQDDFSLVIYPVVNDLPAEPALHLIHMGNVTRQADPVYFGSYQYSVELTAPIELPANIPLALSIYNNSLPGFDDDWAWNTSGLGDGFAIPTNDFSHAWAQDRDYAFSFYGTVVPEPSTVSLLGVGVLSMILMRRKR